MRNLLIGGRGFIGSTLRNLLLQKGEQCQVLGRADCANFSGIRFPAGESRVFYLAHHGYPGVSAEAKEARKSLQELERWLQKISDLSPACLVYFSSGGAVYRPGILAKARTESSPVGPVCHYGRSKLLAERLVQRWGEKIRVRVVILRPGNVYGPGQEALRRVPGFPAAVIRNALADQPVTVYGWPGTVRDYVHVEDVVRGAWLASLRGKAGQIFNLGTGRGLRNEKVLELLRPLLRKEGYRIRIQKAPGRSADVPHVVLGCARAARQLGWRPRVEFEKGIQGWVAEVVCLQKG